MPDKEFAVKPDGLEATVSLTLGDKTCTFTYKCRGGSSEMWTMSAVTEDGVSTFFIGRPSPPSYLLFTSFSATVTPNSGLKDVEVWDNSGVVLQNDQYKIDDGVVKPADGWGGNLALITFRQ